MSEPLPWLEGVLDDRVQGMADRTSPWNRATRTYRVDLARLGRVGLQVGKAEQRERIRRRVDASRFVADAGPRFRVPEVIVDGADADPPFVVTRWVEGRPLSSFLATPSGTMEVATGLHGILGELSRLPPAPPALSSVWADPVLLQGAAAGWLADVAPRLGPRIAGVVGSCVEASTTAVGSAPPVFAHGDVVPVNVLIDGHGTTTLVDFEDARVARGGFDRAMSWTTLAIHHPPAARAFESLIAEPGAGTSLPDRVVLATLGCLQRLERAADALAGLGDETAALTELARVTRLVAGFRRRRSD